MAAAMAVMAGCASGSPRLRMEPAGRFALTRPPQTTAHGLLVEANAVEATRTNEEGPTLHESWDLEVYVRGKDEATASFVLAPGTTRLVVEPVEPLADMGMPDATPQTEDVEPVPDELDVSPEPNVPPDLEEAGLPALEGTEAEDAEPGPLEEPVADDAPREGSAGDALPTNRLDAGIGIASNTAILPATAVQVEGRDQESVHVGPGAKQDVVLRFADVPAYSVLDAYGRPLFVPADATLEIELPSGELLHVPIARAGIGEPSWMVDKTFWTIQARVGTGLTVYGSRDNMVSLDFEAGPQVQFSGVFVSTQLFARLGTRATPLDPERTDKGDPLLGDIISVVGGTLGVGYEVVMVEDINLRFGLGWRPTYVDRDSSDSGQAIHALVGELEVAFRSWDSVPYFRASPRSGWGFFLAISRDLGRLTGPSWESGTALSLGFSLRPMLP